MKKLLVILFSVISVAAYSQIPTGLPTAFNNQWYRFNRYMTVDSLFGLPYRDTNFVAFRAGTLVTRPADSLVYRSTGRTSGKKWDLVGTGGSFGVYTAGNGLSLSSNTFRADTSSVGVATRSRLYKVTDSLSAIISGAVPQTTSVNANYGLSGGGELTTNVSIATDTTLISTRAWRNKARDSVQANLNAGLALKINLSDSSLYASRGRLYKVTDSLGGLISVRLSIADSATFSTKAWRQKAVDSLNGLISTRLTIADSATFSTKAYRQKAVDSLLSVFNTRVSGTTNTIAMFAGSNSVGNSALSQTSTVMTLASRKLDINLPTDTSIVGTLVGTGTNVGAQWVFKNDYNTTGGFVGIAAGETSGDMVLAVGANKKLVFGLGTSGNSRGAEFSENAFKIFQTAGGTSNWVTLGSLTGTQTWLFGGVTSTTGLTLRTTEYVNVTINGTAYKFALVN